MTTKLIIFDLDGVLIDSKEYHFNALNMALEKISKDFVISKKDHLISFDGLPTREKLKKLNIERNLSKEFFNQIWQDKQKFTLDILNNYVQQDEELKNLITKLKDKKYTISVASNSIKITIDTILKKLGIFELIDFYVSHEDVSLSKPHPEIFWKCMIKANSIPENTVIVEDSNFGRLAAKNSHSHLIAVESRADINETLVNKIINILDHNTIKKPWKSDNLNVLIPMAGSGSRFQTQGYTFPKPLIDVKGKPMIQVVVDNLNIQANFIFIVQKEHFERYNLGYLLPLIASNCKIVQVNSVTEGAACTSLLAKEFINNESPLLLANSDQFIEWDSNEIMYSFVNDKIDGAIITFNSTHPKWSYAKIGDDGYVEEVAEKKPISKNATVGIYFWRKGSDYVKYAEQMIKNDIRVNNEFYICPVFNEAIKDGKKIRITEISKSGMWGIGTPEDLNYFLENYKGNI